MNNNNFSHPHRMSPAAFFIIFMKTFKQSVIPCLTIAFLKLFDSLDSTNIGVGMIILTPIAICLAIAFLAAAFSYFPKKFYIKDGNLIFTHGLFNRETTSIPLYRVLSLRLGLVTGSFGPVARPRSGPSSLTVRFSTAY